MLAALMWWIEMAWWIAAIVFVFTLPAVYDLISARLAQLTIDDTLVSWSAGRASGEVELAQIKTVRMDTRLDLSVRVTLLLHSGQKVRIPFEATPPHRLFEEELTARGLSVVRHHFGFI